MSDDQRTARPALPSHEVPEVGSAREEVISSSPGTVDLPTVTPTYPPRALTEADHTLQEIASASEIARALVSIIKKTAAQQKREGMKESPWLVDIKGKDYLCWPAWQLVAARTHLSIRIVDPPAEVGPGLWRSHAMGYDSKNHEVAEEWGFCSRRERGREEAPEHVLAAMASKRAYVRCARQRVGWIIGLAGYPITPAEEMESEGERLSSSQQEDRAVAEANRTLPPRDPGQALSPPGEGSGATMSAGLKHGDHKPSPAQDVPSDAQLRVYCRAAGVAEGFSGPTAGQQWLETRFNRKTFEGLSSEERQQLSKIALEVAKPE